MREANVPTGASTTYGHTATLPTRTFWTWWALGLGSYFAGVFLVGAIAGDQVFLTWILSLTWPALVYVGLRRSPHGLWREPMPLWGIAFMASAVIGRWIPTTATATILVLILMPGIIIAFVARAVLRHRRRNEPLHDLVDETPATQPGHVGEPAAHLTPQHPALTEVEPEAHERYTGINWRSWRARLALAIPAAIILIVLVSTMVNNSQADSRRSQTVLACLDYQILVGNLASQQYTDAELLSIIKSLKAQADEGESTLASMFAMMMDPFGQKLSDAQMIVYQHDRISDFCKPFGVDIAKSSQ